MIPPVAVDPRQEPTNKRVAIDRVRLLSILFFIAWMIVAGATLALKGQEAVASISSFRAASVEWLFVGIGFQCWGFFSDAWIWSPMLRAAGYHAPLPALLRFSATVLSANQLVPTGGASGTWALFRGLARRGVDRRTRIAVTLATAGTFYAGWALALGILVIRLGNVAPLPICGGVGVVGACLALALTSTRFKQAPGAAKRIRSSFRRSSAFARVGRILTLFDARIFSPLLLTRAITLQALTFVIDAATLTVLVRAFGGHLTLADGFVTWMLATIVQAAVPIFNGIGVVETALVLRLHSLGVPVSTSLGSAIILRLVRFWTPVLGSIVARISGSSADTFERPRRCAR